MTAYEKVMAARDANKLTSVDYIAHMFGDSFIELHGDRRYADDKAVVAGLAMLFDTPVTVIGIEKGRNTKERVERNFGQAHPEGYRKALRLMKQAEKFRRPVLCLVDTSGAYPGIGAEERGQGQAIAVIETTKVTVLPFREVSADHAYKEGEGDRSLAYWRQVHEELFTKWLADIGLTFSPESKVVLEEFQVVYKSVKDS